jgi:lysozyme
MAIDLDLLDEEIDSDEQMRLVVYDDATGKPLHPGMTLIGHPTIGDGRALDVNGISKDEAKILRRNDTSRIAGELSERLHWFDDLDAVRQRVLANMAFNLGVAGLIQFHQTLTFTQNGNYAAAADEMLKSQWAKQVGERAIRLSNRMRTGVA